MPHNLKPECTKACWWWNPTVDVYEAQDELVPGRAFWLNTAEDFDFQVGEQEEN